MTVFLSIICGALLVAVVMLVLRSRGSADARLKALTAEAAREVAGQLGEQNREAREADRLTAENELEKRTARIEELTRPVERSLKELNEKVGSLDKQRAESMAETKTLFEQSSEQIRLLGDQTATLSTALRKPQVRGSWGESQLRRCFELAGMSEHVDFALQTTIEAADGRLRPDATVRMPQDRFVVIDSKLPLEAYLDYLNAEDEPSKRTQLSRLAANVRSHIKALASKDYQRQFEGGETPDFVICFIRAESALHAAFDADPGIFDFAIEKKVLLATPTSLIGLLRTIEWGWRQERIAEDALQVAAITRDLHDRFGRFFELFAKLGRSIKSVAGDYEKAGRSIETRLLPQLRRAEQLGAGSGRELKAPERIEHALSPGDGPDEGEVEPADTELRELPLGDDNDADAA